MSDGSPGIIVCDEGSVPNVCIKMEKIFVSIEILRKLWEGHTEITNSQPLLAWPRALVMSDVSADHWHCWGWSIAKLHDPTKDGSFK